jgi:hypothetical protein
MFITYSSSTTFLTESVDTSVHNVYFVSSPATESDVYTQTGDRSICYHSNLTEYIPVPAGGDFLSRYRKLNLNCFCENWSQ